MAKKTALVLSGGGAKGEFQVGVLEALKRAVGPTLEFCLFTGVSVGALNATFLAQEQRFAEGGGHPHRDLGQDPRERRRL